MTQILIKEVLHVAVDSKSFGTWKKNCDSDFDNWQLGCDNRLIKKFANEKEIY